MTSIYDVGKGTLLGNKGADADKYVSIIVQEADVDLSITFDCTKSLSVSKPSISSEYAVEGRETISDHVEIKNPSVRINAFISNASVSLIDKSWADGAGTAAGAAGLSIFGEDIAQGVGFLAGETAPILGSDSRVDVPYSKARRAYDILDNIRNGSYAVTIITEYEVFQDMIINDLDFPKDGSSGKALWVNLTAKRQKVSEAKVTTINIDAVKAKGEQGTSSKNKGSQPSPEQGSSVAKGLKNIFLGEE